MMLLLILLLLLLLIGYRGTNNKAQPILSKAMIRLLSKILVVRQLRKSAAGLVLFGAMMKIQSCKRNNSIFHHNNDEHPHHRHVRTAQIRIFRAQTSSYDNWNCCREERSSNYVSAATKEQQRIACCSAVVVLLHRPRFYSQQL